MAFGSTREERYGPEPSVIHQDSAHSGSIIVPDAHLLFTGDFRRAGPDLVLTGHDGRHHLIPGYFSGEHRPALVAPNGASLSPELVDLLAGSPTPGEYAQAQPATPPDAIGRVEKVVGDVTIVRNGISVALNVGDAVYQSDVIQTGADSGAGIGFPDGTALNLVANTRMALSDYSYDPNSTSNGALFTLVEGTFAFVAGKVAHTGDMKIATPVATMGIRGTTGFVQEQVATVTANLGNVSYSFAVVNDQGTNASGQYDLIDQSGNVIASVSQTGYVTFVTPQGPGLAPLVSILPVTASQLALEQQVVQELFQTLDLLNATPHTNPGGNGSGTPPDQLNGPLLPQLIHDNGTTLPITIPGNGSSGTNTGTVIIDILAPPPIIKSNVVIWTSPNGGPFETAPNWNINAVPDAASTVEIITPVLVTVGDAETVNNLLIAAGSSLDVISGGVLTILSGLDNSGLVEATTTGADPMIEIIGATTVRSDAAIEAIGSGTTVDFMNNVATNAGTIAAANAGLVSFEFYGLANVSGGTLQAQQGGTVTLDHSTVDNTDSGANDGSIEVNGPSSTVILNDGTTVVGGTLSTTDGSLIEIANGTGETNSNVTFDGSQIIDSTVLAVTIDGSVQIEAGTSLTLLGTIHNMGSIDVDNGEVSGATLVIGGTVTLDGSGTILLDGSTDEIIGAAVGGTFDNVNDTISGSGQIFGTALAPLILDNESLGVIDADVSGGTLTIDTPTNAVINAGVLEAVDGGALLFSDTSVTNTGLVEATGTDSILDLRDATISGGAVATTGSTDIIEATSGPSAIRDTTSFSNAGTLEANGADDLDLINSTVTNIGTAEATGTDGTLDLRNATINGGTVATTGSTDVVEATSGISTISDTTSFSNAGTLEANGAQLDLVDSTVTNTGLVEVTGTDGILDLRNATISGGAVATTGSTDIIEATSGPSAIRDTTSFSNAGMLEANGADDLDLINTTVANIGTAEATGADGTLDLRSATINGGAVATTGSTDVIEATSGISTISDTTSFSNAGTLEANGAQLDLVDSPVNNTGLVEATGTDGTVDLRSATISGGTVATTGSTDIIEATSGASTISDTTSFSNAGTLLANDADLNLTDDSINNTGGTIEAIGSNAAIDLEFATIVGGILETIGGLIETGSGNSTFENLAIAPGSEVLLNADTSLTLLGSIDNQGAINVDSVATSGANLTIEGSVTLDGSGNVTLDGASDEITGAPGGGILHNVNDTISGGGQIFGTVDHALTLDNQTQGVIDADIAGGPLTLETGANAVINAGLLEATNGGTLVISDTSITNTGTVEAVDPASNSPSEVALENASINDGTVATIADGIIDATLGIDTIYDASINNAGTLEADGATLELTNDLVNNSGGLIEAIGYDATINLDGTSITGGILETGAGGIIETAHGNGTFDDLTIAGRSDVLVNADTSLALLGTIDNLGAITMGSSDPNLVIDGTVTLDGGGQVILSGSGDNIVGETGSESSNVLINYDDISGAGNIGYGGPDFNGVHNDSGNSHSDLTLMNNSGGLIDANDTNEALTLDTGWNTVTNAGTLEASDGGRLNVWSDVDNSHGSISAASDGLVDIADDIWGGSATIAGGELIYGGSSNVDTTFNNGTSGHEYGLLALDDAPQFSGDIFGFAGTDLQNSDAIDLVGISPEWFTEFRTDHGQDLVLTAWEGFNPVASLTFVDFNGNLDFGSDGHDGTLITDPPANAPTAEGAISIADAQSIDGYSESVTPASADSLGTFSLGDVSENNGTASVSWEFSLGSDPTGLSTGETLTQSYDVAVTDAQGSAAHQTVSVSLGGPGNDNFVFEPGMGNDTIVNFNPQVDTIELNNFVNIQSIQQLSSLVTSDGHGDAVIDLSHGDSITLPGMNITQLQQVLASTVHLH